MDLCLFQLDYVTIFILKQGSSNKGPVHCPADLRGAQTLTIGCRKCPDVSGVKQRPIFGVSGSNCARSVVLLGGSVPHCWYNCAQLLVCLGAFVPC